MNGNSQAHRSVSQTEQQKIEKNWKLLSSFMIGLMNEIKVTGDEELFPGFRVRSDIKEMGQRARQLWLDRNGAAAVRELRQAKIALLITLRSFSEKTLCADLRKDLTSLRLAPELHSQGETAIAAFEKMLVSARDNIDGFDPYGAANQYRHIEDLLNELEDRQKELKELRAAQVQQERARKQAAQKERFEHRHHRRVEDTRPLAEAFS